MITAFFDIDTQLDFLYPSGALYAPGAERVIPAIAKLNEFARRSGSPVVSTMDAHSENDPEFQSWPAHCVLGTVGQRKDSSTLLSGAAVIPNRDGAVIPNAPQLLLEKQHVDAFTNVNLDRLLSTLKADHFVVYGVVTEICVRHAAFGLLRYGKPVAIVTDAVGHLREAASYETLQEFERRGGSLVTVASVTGTL
jgi:nicotinamidase/pyrazinamidase